MESYSDLYLAFAAQFRRKAVATTDPKQQAALFKLATAYERAAEAMQPYPEAA